MEPRQQALCLGTLLSQESAYNELMHAYRRHLLLLVAVGSLMPLTPAVACFWDSDTLAWEARAFPGLTEVITGRFPRNPPLYYQMRLKRATAQIAAHPDDFAAYDDAGASCDRLQDDDAAIAWMEKKRVRLARWDPSDAVVREHWYRYHANVGTFWAHRWLRRGADRTRICEMKTARDHIAQGIALNPDAHFGREKYQLLAMEWIVAGDPEVSLAAFLASRLPDPLEDTARERRKKAIQGLSGLIVLGNAWESVDVFAALASLLTATDDSSASYLAILRCRELLAAGRRSLCPGGSSANGLEKALRFYKYQLRDSQKNDLRAQYRSLRAEAAAWQKQRTQLMLTRLAAGRHPDTDAGFWSGWHEPPPPSLGPAWPGNWMTLLLIGLGSLVVVRAGVKTGRWLRKRF
jgi:hypothetical protein